MSAPFPPTPCRVWLDRDGTPAVDDDKELLVDVFERAYPSVAPATLVPRAQWEAVERVSKADKTVRAFENTHKLLHQLTDELQGKFSYILQERDEALAHLATFFPEAVMITQDEAWARVLAGIKAHDWTTSTHDKLADKIVEKLYAPRTRLREVVAPSGAVVTYTGRDFRASHKDGTGFVYFSAVECAFYITDGCTSERDAFHAQLMDLQARPTEEVPS